MARLVVRYADGGSVRWGQIKGEAPRGPLEKFEISLLEGAEHSTSSLIAAFDEGRVSASRGVRISGSQLLSPVTSDATIFCQGLNYAKHAAEAQHAVRKSNLIFSKASSSLTGPYGDIVRPASVQLLDYEVEFGVVLRKTLTAPTEVTDRTIGDIVAGVVLANDVSARDTMFGSTFFQWFQGKSARTFCPVGPALWLFKRDEVADALGNIQITLWLNGELRQQAKSTELIWKPAESISYISGQMDMKRGDLLLTGTPGGVTTGGSPRLVEIMREYMMDDERRLAELRIEMVKNRPFMQPGDVCSAELRDVRTNQSLGGLANTIAGG